MIATFVYKIITIAILAGILPLCAQTYYTFRLGQRRLEVGRILHILDITSEYKDIYSFDIRASHYAVSVLFATAVAVVGLSSLFLSAELELGKVPNILLGFNQVSVVDCGIASAAPDPGAIKESSENCRASPKLERYQQGALLAYGFGFLGAYLWGLQNIIRRYSMNDLLPTAFFRFGLRMIFSSVVALLIYHAVGGFSDPAPAAGGGNDLMMPTADGVLLLLVFMVGMFPQRGINWILARINLVRAETHESVEPLPLTMIEGMTDYDQERLAELGIDSCYDLATADFIPLLLKTPYGSRELINWLLQAKLCVRFGASVGELRKFGFNTITDLANLSEEEMEEMSRDSSLSLSRLRRATRVTESDYNIERLQRAAEALGKYWEGEPDPVPTGAAAREDGTKT